MIHDILVNEHIHGLEDETYSNTLPDVTEVSLPEGRETMVVLMLVFVVQETYIPST